MDQNTQRPINTAIAGLYSVSDDASKIQLCLPNAKSMEMSRTRTIVELIDFWMGADKEWIDDYYYHRSMVYVGF